MIDRLGIAEARIVALELEVASLRFGLAALDGALSNLAQHLIAHSDDLPGEGPLKRPRERRHGPH